VPRQRGELSLQQGALRFQGSNEGGAPPHRVGEDAPPMTRGEIIDVMREGSPETRGLRSGSPGRGLASSRPRGRRDRSPGGLTTGVGAEELQHHETFAKKAAHRSGERVERRSLLRGERPRGVHAVPFRKGGPSPVSRGMSMRTHPSPHPLVTRSSGYRPQPVRSVSNATSAWQLGFTHPPRAALPPAVRIPRGVAQGIVPGKFGRPHGHDGGCVK